MASQRPLHELAQLLSPRARLILREDADFEQAKRVWNGLYDAVQPLAVARVGGVSDVIAIINYAAKENITVTPRGGNHSWPGHSIVQDGIVIDFSQMRSVAVNPKTKEAVVEPGALLGDLDHETGAFGLAMPVGVISHTGVYGLVLGGGVGWLVRKYGASVDSILSADIVLADGSLVTANHEENPDLFWAIRGAAANFGVVVSLTLRLYPVREAYRGALHYPGSQTRQVLIAMNKFMQTAPREFQAEFYNRGDLNGEPLLKVCYSFYLPRGEAEGLAEPLKHIGEPHSQEWSWISHVLNQKIFDPESPHHRQYYAKTGGLKFDELDETFLEGTIKGIYSSPTEFSMVELIGLGGAMSEPGPEATAFYPLRASDWLVNIVAGWYDSSQTEECKKWVQDTFVSLGKTRVNSGYINMAADATADNTHHLQARLNKAFGPNLPRLQALKAKYDPTNFFRHNFNIPPMLDESSDTASVKR